jgi:hypothetical protein
VREWGGWFSAIPKRILKGGGTRVENQRPAATGMPRCVTGIQLRIARLGGSRTDRSGKATVCRRAPKTDGRGTGYVPHRVWDDADAVDCSGTRVTGDDYGYGT